MIDEKAKIGKQLTLLRKRRKMSKLELSKLSGISRQNIVKLESGTYNASVDVFNKLLEPLGCYLGIRVKMLWRYKRHTE
jgi:transcriptional regulator with XRE-family HTH domain